jgi:hypothetical protein
MANFLDTTADIDLAVSEFEARLVRIESHLRRGEKRAARARLSGFLEELIEFAHEIELPLETIVVGSQLGFFSGGSLLRGRLPAALIGGLAGWLYGQQVVQQHRLVLENLATRVAALTLFLESDAAANDEAAEATAEPAAEAAGERVTLEVDRE